MKIWPKLSTLLAALLLGAFAIGIQLGCGGCNTTNLDPSGTYVTGTNAVSVATDKAFFQIDAAFDLAYSLIDGAFRFEQQNRATLWQISPEVKKTLDKVRPEAQKVVSEYTTARSAYLAGPTTNGLVNLQAYLEKMQQLSQTAVSTLPKK